MATNPTPSTCLKCSTPLVPGTAFCGTCGTPAGSPGRPPIPPPMPPRPLSHGARQVIVPMDQPQAIHTVGTMLPRVGGEIVNHSPVQLAFRIGGFLNGRHTGTVDSFPEGPQRTALNVSLKPDYSSLIPTLGVAALLSLILLVISAREGWKAMTVIDPYTGTMYQPGIWAFLTWWLILLLFLIGAGLRAWILAGPQLESRRANLQNALQSIGGMPPGMQGTPHQGFGPQAGPMGAGIPGQGAPVQATPFEQLRKLAELRDSGAISVDDFEKAKADIMKKIA